MPMSCSQAERANTTGMTINQRLFMAASKGLEIFEAPAHRRVSKLDRSWVC